MLPFSTADFLSVFAGYNEAVWPAQWVLLAVAGTAVALGLTDLPSRDRWVAWLLALLWAWSGVAYHAVWFSTINPLAYAFALGFLAQAALLARAGLRTDSLRFELRLDVRGVTAAALIAYALVAYPLLGFVLGHRYPAAPTFGVPCPLTIFTLGMLCAERRGAGGLLVIPCLWGVVGGSAAFLLDVREDLGLLAAVAVVVALHVLERVRGRGRRGTEARGVR